MKKSDAPYAIIQIDCDREWHDIDISSNILLEFINIFKENNIKSTLFVVGNDLEEKAYKNVIIKSIEAGHEIANHTYSHKKDFIALKPIDKMNEILKCDRMIHELDYTPMGFRTPYFGLDYFIPHILKDLNYAYDSSICPSPVLYTISKLKDILNTGIFKSDSFTKGKNIYMPNIEKIESAGIHEIPVSVFPYFSLPSHASYTMVLPFNLSRWYTRILLNNFIKTKKPLVYIFHLNDLCPEQHLTSKEFRFFIPLKKRRDFVKWICKEISKNFNIILTKDFVNLNKSD